MASSIKLKERLGSARLRTAFLIWMTLAVAARPCGQSWERLGPEGGMVLSLGVDSAGTVYLDTSDGHVFASEDRAARWELRGRVGPRTDAVVAALAADPRIPGKAFAAVWFSRSRRRRRSFPQRRRRQNLAARGFARQSRLHTSRGKAARGRLARCEALTGSLRAERGGTGRKP